MTSKKIQSSKNYALFNRHEGENRPLEPGKRGRLKDSMRRYGFLKCFPIVCYRDKDGKLVVKDGQHRLAIAQELGLPIFWVEEETDFDVAITNSAQKGWAVRDYAKKWAANGISAYIELLDFCERYRIGISDGAAMLAGTVVFQNTSRAFHDGTFKIKDRKWAESVGTLYSQMCEIGPLLKNKFFLAACAAVCRVEGFDAARLINGAQRCREKLLPYFSRDAYLDVIESLYNFGRHKLQPIKLPAISVMRERGDVAKGKKKKKSENKGEAA